MQITGHNSLSMFKRYAIVDESQKRNALAQMQEYLKKTTPKIIPMRQGRQGEIEPAHSRPCLTWQGRFYWLF